jgi:WD40 repeat protein
MGLHSLAWSFDGKVLASGGGTCGFSIMLWDAKKGKRLTEL